MARKAKRDLTVEEQLARGPMDLPLLMLTLLLLGVGLIMVLSASYATAYYDPKTDSPLAYAIAQTRYAIIGLVGMYFVSKFNYQYLRILSLPMLLGSIVLLVLVPTPLGVTLNGAQRWLKSDTAPADVQRFAAQWGGHATCFTPGTTREPFQPLPPALLRVHRQLKAQLDPHAIFNPGRLYADF